MAPEPDISTWEKPDIFIWCLHRKVREGFLCQVPRSGRFQAGPPSVDRGAVVFAADGRGRCSAVRGLRTQVAPWDVVNAEVRGAANWVS
jgi:hypothetical protein